MDPNSFKKLKAISIFNIFNKKCIIELILMSPDIYFYSEIDGGYRIGTHEENQICSGVSTGFQSHLTNKSPVSPSIYNNKYILEIGRCGFAYTKITKVTISAPVRAIRNYAFDICSVLREVNLPSTISYIGSNAFKDCKSLALINICRNESITTGNNVFYNIVSSITINVPSTSLIDSINDKPTTKVLSSRCIFDGARNLIQSCKKRNTLNRISLLMFCLIIYSK